MQSGDPADVEEIHALPFAASVRFRRAWIPVPFGMGHAVGQLYGGRKSCDLVEHLGSDRPGPGRIGGCQRHSRNRQRHRYHPAESRIARTQRRSARAGRRVRHLHPHGRHVQPNRHQRSARARLTHQRAAFAHLRVGDRHRQHRGHERCGDRRGLRQHRQDRHDHQPPR